MGLDEKRMIVLNAEEKTCPSDQQEIITSPPKHLGSVKYVQRKKLDFSMRAKRGEDGPPPSFDEASVSMGSIIFFLYVPKRSET